MTYFTVLGVTAFVIRLLWPVDYLRRFYRSTSGAAWHERPRFSLQRSMGATTSALEGSTTAGDHQAALGVSDKQLDTSLVGGSIGLAAWTQLFVSSSSGPAQALKPETLSLLFAGCLILLSAPLFFRVPGLHMTYIGRECGSSLGFALVTISLFSMMADLLAPGWIWIPVVIATLLVVRDAADVIQQLLLQRILTFT
jgi:hypothetical protein